MQERCRHNFCYKTCANTNIVITLHYINMRGLRLISRQARFDGTVGDV